MLKGHLKHPKQWFSQTIQFLAFRLEWYQFSLTPKCDLYRQKRKTYSLSNPRPVLSISTLPKGMSLIPITLTTRKSV